MNEEIMKEWVTKIFRLRKEGFFLKPSLLAYDSKATHNLKSIKTLLKANDTTIAVIPGSLLLNYSLWIFL